MATEVIMPKMGFDMTEGTLLKWLKQEGEQVQRGEFVAEIETDKAVVEIEAFGSGVLRKRYVREGTTVPVGQVIGVIGQPEETVPEAPAARGVAPAQPAPAAAVSAPREVQPHPAAAPSEERLKASPLAKKEAESRGLDLAKVPGTGPGGRITREDVIAFAEKSPPTAPVAPPAATTVAAGTGAQLGALLPLSRMRQAIARNMSKSKREIPHFYVTMSVDMGAAVSLREQLNASRSKEEQVSFNDLVIKAAALALVKYPRFNASFTEQGVQIFPRINIGIAVALEDGLLAPGINDCDKKGVLEIARDSKAVAGRARANKLNADEYGNATFVVTNLGMYKVDAFSAIITPPLATALAVGMVRQVPVVKAGQLAIGERMDLTLSVDHRVNDGAQAAVFLGEVRSLLESPVRLLL